jgi:hypothetical protein
MFQVLLFLFFCGSLAQVKKTKKRGFFLYTYKKINSSSSSSSSRGKKERKNF